MPSNRKPQHYSLFEYQVDYLGRKHYTRISEVSYPLEQARRVYQSQLLAYAFGECALPRALKTVKRGDD